MTRHTVDEKIEILRKVASADKKEFLKLLPKVLVDRSPTLREVAVLLVLEHRLKRAISTITPLLKDENENVRYSTAQCVGILLSTRQAPPPELTNLLADESALVRAQALESLTLLKEQAALPRIARLLSDEDPIVRSYAATAVGVLNGVEYVEKLRHCLLVEKHDLARVGFYESLFLLGERKLLPELLRMLRSRDYHVRCSVANTVEALPLRKPEVKMAISALTEASRNPIARADGDSVRRALESLARVADGWEAF